MYVVECGAERPKKVKLVDKATMQIWAQPRTNRRTRFHGIQLRWQPVRTACTCLTIRLCPPIGVFFFSLSSCSSTLWRQDFPKLNPTSKRASSCGSYFLDLRSPGGKGEACRAEDQWEGKGRHNKGRPNPGRHLFLYDTAVALNVKLFFGGSWACRFLSRPPACPAVCTCEITNVKFGTRVW